ncbi:MAG: alkene reductase, partial [Gloeobacteraceae cyanobacterium ES-bin-316]|nr:alkene reductase [Ferruginibacter sp.]
QALHNGFADLVGFARLFLANPDFDKRLENGSLLNVIDPSTFYSPGAKGYTDYPFLHQLEVLEKNS